MVNKTLSFDSYLYSNYFNIMFHLCKEFLLGLNFVILNKGERNLDTYLLFYKLLFT